MTRLVTSMVIHPPALNFSNTVMTRMVAQSASAVPKSRTRARHSARRRRSRIQKRSMAAIDSEKVRKTLMDQVPHIAPGVQQRSQRRAAHQDDAVPGGEPLA